MTRAFTAPVDAKRCEATRRPLKDGTLARCMLRRRPGDKFCARHRKEADARVRRFEELNGRWKKEAR